MYLHTYHIADARPINGSFLAESFVATGHKHGPYSYMLRSKLADRKLLLVFKLQSCVLRLDNTRRQIGSLPQHAADRALPLFKYKKKACPGTASVSRGVKDRASAAEY